MEEAAQNNIKPIKLKLSIQVSPNGLSFCILNCDINEIAFYKKTEFPTEYNPVKILELIEECYQKEEALQEEINEVSILFSNNLYTLVPAEYFVENEASNYLKFNTRILKTDLVAHDTFAQGELVTVYIPYTNITNYFFDKYGEFEYKHTISLFAQEMLNSYSGTATKAYLNNNKGYYDLVIVKENKLLFCNSFTYETKEDFIYYLLFTAEQLELDLEQLELWLLGKIDEDSPFFKIAYTYIKKVALLNPRFSFEPSEIMTPQFQKEAYILLKSLQCE